MHCQLHPTDKLFGSDFASCILISVHPVAAPTTQRRINFGSDSASCILLHIPHTADTKHFGLGSALCILHLQSAYSEKYGM